MKELSLVLGKSNLRSILLPGAVVALGLHPLLAPLARKGGLPLSDAVLMVIEIAFFGLLLSSASRSIFYVLEGFRCPGLLHWNKRRLEARVTKWTSELKQLQQRSDELSDREETRAGLLAERLLWFPVDPPGSDDPIRARVASPTMLGNLIAAYEEYPWTRYGIDGEHFWFHFLYLAPAPALADFEELEDTASSLALSAFGAFAVAVSYIVFFLGRLVCCVVPQASLVDAQVSDLTAGVILALASLGSVLFYYMSLRAFRYLGRSFQALIDITLPKLREFLQGTDFELSQEEDDRAEALRLFQRFNIRQD